MKFLTRLLLAWLLSAISIVVTSSIMPGMAVDGFGSAMWAALILAIVYTIIFPILVVLTLPITILTLGLFLLVLNGAMLMLAASFVDGFMVSGWLAAIVGAILLTLMESLLKWMVPKIS